jgi:hypothetical protein
MKKYVVVKAQAYKTFLVEIDTKNFDEGVDATRDEIVEFAYGLVEGEFEYEEAEVEEIFNEGDKVTDRDEDKVRYWTRHADQTIK